MYSHFLSFLAFLAHLKYFWDIKAPETLKIYKLQPFRCKQTNKIHENGPQQSFWNLVLRGPQKPTLGPKMPLKWPEKAKIGPNVSHVVQLRGFDRKETETTGSLIWWPLLGRNCPGVPLGERKNFQKKIPSASKEVLRHSTPRASKVHCSINGLENSSSPKYSKVQHLFGVAVWLFSARLGLGKSPTSTKKVLLWPKKSSLKKSF